MLILLTNDDGIHADGLKALEKALKPVAETIVFAPDREQSASSHSLTLNRPLRILERGKNRYTCDGTPTDCVMLAVHGILRHRLPDLLISGINHGANMGEDVTYSGTVAAAIEGATMGIPSIAVSNTDALNLSSYLPAARFVAKLIRQYYKLEIPPAIFLNINFPTLTGSRFTGYRYTCLGQRRYNDVVIEKTDPRGKHYYWIAGESTWDNIEGSDFEAVSNGLVSISPLKMNFTHQESFNRIKNVKLRF
ncbi:MAG: 5'/3'-nucleotidase SurE [candidate division Zixibacteria bacterium]|nr:5'/3'-nucleotidase SurE [candidate division Zixibacteria bacterium]